MAYINIVSVESGLMSYKHKRTHLVVTFFKVKCSDNSHRLVNIKANSVSIMSIDNKHMESPNFASLQKIWTLIGFTHHIFYDKCMHRIEFGFLDQNNGSWIHIDGWDY